MSIELTPAGTYGVHMRKLPGLFWNLFSMAVRLRGGRVLNLTTTGAKTGRQHTIPLSFYPSGDPAGQPDENGPWLIVASNGGARRHPAWYINMARNPEKIWITIGKRKWQVQAESLKGAQRDETFRRIAALFPNYTAYQTKTDRVIPVVRLTAAP